MQNYLVAIEAAVGEYWWYRCTRCGNNRSRHNKRNVKNGHTRSCGCLWYRTGLANPIARNKPAGTRFAHCDRVAYGARGESTVEMRLWERGPSAPQPHIGWKAEILRLSEGALPAARSRHV